MSTSKESIITEKLSNAISELEFEKMPDMLESVLSFKSPTQVSFFNPYTARPRFHEANKLFFEQHKSKKFPCMDGCKVFGESHEESTAKFYLIENMSALKKEGFEVLYLEHVFFDKMQPLLEEYYSSPEGTPMPAPLAKFLDELTEGHMEAFDDFGDDFGEDEESEENFSKLYNYRTLVEAAKKNGIRIIALDSSFSYAMNVEGLEEDTNDRQYAMNHQATSIINKIAKGRKWFALVGNSHVKHYLEAPGLADMFDKTESVYVRDTNNTVITKLAKADSTVVIPMDLYDKAYKDPRKIIKDLGEDDNLYKRLDLPLLVKCMIQSDLESTKKNEALKSFLSILKEKASLLKKENRAEIAISMLSSYLSKRSQDVPEPVKPVMTGEKPAEGSLPGASLYGLFLSLSEKVESKGQVDDLLSEIHKIFASEEFSLDTAMLTKISGIIEGLSNETVKDELGKLLTQYQDKIARTDSQIPTVIFSGPKPSAPLLSGSSIASTPSGSSIEGTMDPQKKPDDLGKKPFSPPS